MAPHPTLAAVLVPRGEDSPKFEPWMAAVIVGTALILTAITDAVYGFRVAKFFKNLFLFLVWHPLHSLIHRYFPGAYGRYGLKQAAKNRDAGKFTGEGCPRFVIPMLDFGDGMLVDMARTTPLPPSPTDVPLPESPVSDEPPRGRSPTRAPATSARNVHEMSPSPQPDRKIRPRRKWSLAADEIDLTIGTVRRVPRCGAGLEAAVMLKEAKLAIEAAEAAAAVAKKMHMEAKVQGAALVRTRALRQLAADQIRWSRQEYWVVQTEAFLLTLSPYSAGIRDADLSDVARRRREEMRAEAQRLRAAAAIARAPLESV